MSQDESDNEPLPSAADIAARRAAQVAAGLNEEAQSESKWRPHHLRAHLD